MLPIPASTARIPSRAPCGVSGDDEGQDACFEPVEDFAAGFYAFVQRLCSAPRR